MIGYLILTHIVLAVVATIVVFRLDYFERPQAIFQSVISWVIPFLGSVLVLVFQSVVYSNMATKAQPEKANLNSKHIEADALQQELDSGD